MGRFTLAELFRRSWAGVGPSAPLLSTPSGLTLTYGDVAGRADQMMTVLCRAGLGPGDRLAVQVHKSPDAVALYLACLRLGAVYLPLNPAYTVAEVQHVLSDARPALLVADPELVVPDGPPTLTLDAAGGGTLLEQAEAHRGESVPADARVGPDDVAVLLYTSGTTGRPKGAPLTQANLGANVETLGRAWGFSQGDCVMHVLPLYHAHGLLVALNLVLANGCSMVWFDRFEPDALLAEFRRSTVFMGVPTHYVRLLAEDGLDASSVEGIRLWVSGSAPLLSATHAEWERRTGQRILERYGMTETVMLTSNPLVGERRPGSVGLPLPGVEVRVVPDQGGEGIGEIGEGIGEIQVRGPSVFSGYWERPELDGETFAPGGWFRTGDLGVLESDGYLRIVGRAKDLVISGGLNVYPKEIEMVLDSLPGVEESAVVGLAHPDLGEAVTAMVVARAGAQLDGEELRRAARQHLAGYKVPRRIQVVAELPRNAMGKVQKTTIRRLLASLPANDPSV